MKHLLILILLIPTITTGLTKNQKEILTQAYEAGLKIGYPETMQAICYLESSAGKNKLNSSDPSYGVGHMKIKTAQEVVRKILKLKTNLFTDEKLIEHLMNDDLFAISLMTFYFNFLIGHYKKMSLIYKKNSIRYKNKYNNTNVKRKQERQRYKELFLRYRKKSKENYWEKSVLAYNVGMGNVNKYGLNFDPNNYLSKIRGIIKDVVKPFNEENKL